MSLKSQLLPAPDNVLTALRKEHNLDKPNRLEEAVNMLSEWVKRQTHFIKKEYSKQYLEILLIQSKGSVEKAKTRLDNLATMRTLLPKLFIPTYIKENEEEFKNVFQSIITICLPVITHDLYRVAIIKLLKKHNDTEIFLRYYQLMITVYEYLKSNDYVNGYIIIFDLQDTSVLDIATNVKLVEFHQLITTALNGYGLRLKAVYIITECKAINLILKSVKPILGQKIYSRIKVIQKAEDLLAHNYIPEEILPIEYGGKEVSIFTLRDKWVKEINSAEYQEYLKDMSKAGTDEKLRSSCKYNAEILGMPGSFRHLNLD